MTSRAVIQNAIVAQDVQLASALADITATDNTAITNYLNKQANTLRNQVTKNHSDNFSTTYASAVNTGNTIKNIMWYNQRNKDLYNTQTAVLSRATDDAQGVQRDNQTSKRQFEINEWTANNKLDTLFIMQLIFIGLMILVPLMYLTRMGIIPYSAFYGVSVLVLIAIILTFVVRLQYTSNTRDLRYWNRRRFARQGGPPTPPTCDQVASAAQGVFSSGPSSVPSSA
jgi:hypothetical protein